MDKADQLRIIADWIDDQEISLEEIQRLTRLCIALERENDYLTDLLEQAGIPIGKGSISLGKELEIRNALRNIT